GDHGPAHEQHGADHHERALLDLDVLPREPPRAADHRREHRHGPQRPEPEEDDAPHLARHGGAQQAQLEGYDGRNHDHPASGPRAPSRSKKRSSSSAPARTSSSGPVASTRPAPITATWSHIRSTSAMTCEDSTTVPPSSTNSPRILRMTPAETGSTASKGSSSTRSRGACTSAHASVIFFDIPAEKSARRVRAASCRSRAARRSSRRSAMTSRGMPRSSPAYEMSSAPVSRSNTRSPSGSTPSSGLARAGSRHRSTP